MNKNRLYRLTLSETEDPQVPLPSGPARERLPRVFSRLDYIRIVREYRQDPGFGKDDEEQMIGRELLDLMLLEAGEQMQRTFESMNGDSA